MPLFTVLTQSWHFHLDLKVFPYLCYMIQWIQEHIINIFFILPSPNDDLPLLAGLSSMQWLKLQCVTLCWLPMVHIIILFESYFCAVLDWQSYPAPHPVWAWIAETERLHYFNKWQWNGYLCIVQYLKLIPKEKSTCAECQVSVSGFCFCQHHKPKSEVL